MRFPIPLGTSDAVRHLEVAPGRRQDQDPVAVDELGEDADRVLEAALLADVLGGQVVERLDLARVADADRHPEVAQLRVLAPGHELPQRVDRVHRLLAALDLAARQVVGAGAVDPGQVDQVEVGEVALVGDRSPRPGERDQVLRDEAPASTACLNGLRRNGENISSSLPVVSMSHSALPAQSR